MSNHTEAHHTPHPYREVFEDQLGQQLTCKAGMHVHTAV